MLKVLNETGFQKILKKFDKTAGWKASQLYLKKLQKYHWAKSTKIEDFIKETEVSLSPFKDIPDLTNTLLYFERKCI